jgi:5-methylcytosine-specific restriction endonuclease McrA|tara:strand:- start:74 stop:280 length:207 start_codon:yes stop_codon:yes gene_type:complete
MRRNFTSRQKIILKILSGNKCSICEISLNENYHADHIKPFIKKGKSVIQNGQALCQKCNLQKGAKYYG